MQEETNVTISLNSTKEELERAKLLVEVEELKRDWWKKPAYIGAFFPTVLAFTTLLYGFANGYFQASFVKLENENFKLEKQKTGLLNQISEFEQKKTEIQAQINDMQNRLNKYSKELEQANKTNNFLRAGRRAGLPPQVDIDELIKENENLKKENKALKETLENSSKK